MAYHISQFDSSETSTYTIKSLPLKLEDSVRMITFNDMHPKIPKSEEKKSAGADLIKDREQYQRVVHRGRQPHTKNMTFSFILLSWWHLFYFETYIFLDS
jgi:hypothetical protein